MGPPLRMRASPRSEFMSRCGPQAREHLEARIAIGRHAVLDLEITHGPHGVLADAPVGPVRVKSQRGQAALDFLHLG